MRGGGVEGMYRAREGENVTVETAMARDGVRQTRRKSVREVR